MDKTRRVEINRSVQHPKYKKYISRRTVCHVHDETNESQIGDLVEIIESAPVSKLKRWSLVRVIEKSTEVDLVALRAARKEAEQAEAAGAGVASEDSSSDSSSADAGNGGDA